MNETKWPLKIIGWTVKAMETAKECGQLNVLLVLAIFF